MRSTFVFIMLLASFAGFAQTSEHQKFASGQENGVKANEFEVFAGISCPIASYHGADPKPAQMIGFAYRYNISGSNWDIGTTLQIEVPSYDFLHDGNRNKYQKNRTTSILIAGNYNFRQGNRVNTFAGVGVGWANNEVIPSYNYFYSKGNTIGVVPKIGVEFFSIIRLTGYAQISRRGYNSIGAHLGVTIGGWKK